MIRELIESTYKRVEGAVRSLLTRSGAPKLGRSGLIQILYVVVVVALLAGFDNAVVLPVPNQAEFIYPASGNQTIPETFIDAMVILMGGAGIYLAYISGRQTTRTRMVNLYLAISLLLIAVAVLMGLYLASPAVK